MGRATRDRVGKAEVGKEVNIKEEEEEDEDEEEGEGDDVR